MAAMEINPESLRSCFLNIVTFMKTYSVHANIVRLLAKHQDSKEQLVEEFLHVLKSDTVTRAINTNRLIVTADKFSEIFKDIHEKLEINIEVEARVKLVNKKFDRVVNFKFRSGMFTIPNGVEIVTKDDDQWAGLQLPEKPHAIVSIENKRKKPESQIVVDCQPTSKSESEKKRKNPSSAPSVMPKQIKTDRSVSPVESREENSENEHFESDQMVAEMLSKFKKKINKDNLLSDVA